MQICSLTALSVAALFCAPISALAATTSDSCSTVAACVLGTNTSTGIGVNGTSSNGFGVEGSTSVAATSASTARAGMFGKDTTNSSSVRFNSGVSGTSTYGYGVYGQVKSGTAGYFLATSGGYGVVGTVEGNGTAGDFSTYQGTALQAIVAPPRYPAGTPTGGTAISAYATGGPTLIVSGSDDLQDLVVGQSPHGNGTAFTIDSSGNEVLAGTLTQNGSPSVITNSATGARVTSYGARSASPTIEDFGTGTLRAGAATVALDATFASTIAPGYMVFITPHGDSNGLYTVAGARSFTVRENKAGRSTLAFDYRIVARPLDAKGGHLPAASALRRYRSIRPR